MAHDVSPWIHFGSYRRVSSVVVTGICILCSIPQEGVCAAAASESGAISAEVVHAIARGDEARLVEQFDELEKAIEASQDRLEESRKFLNSFVQQLNAQYGVTLTLEEGCALVQQNIEMFQLKEEERIFVLAVVERLLANPAHFAAHIQNRESPTVHVNHGLSWPWEWNWWGMNKKKHKNPGGNVSMSCQVSPNAPKFPDNDPLPPYVYTGGAEVLAGCLACILGTVFTPAWALGVGLVVDGTRRMYSGIEADQPGRS
jgi:hypothetical protein